VWRLVEIYDETWDGIYRMRETTTDPDGHFTIPRWGPRSPHDETFIDKRGPELWVLRSGYLLGYFDNTGSKAPFAPIPDPGAAETNLPLEFIILPPGKMPPHRREEYARSANGSSIWNGKILKLKPAGSPAEQARSLAAADPLDPYLLGQSYPPLFWAEWQNTRATLPSAWQNSVVRPRSLIDMRITRMPTQPTEPIR
jgi:hypothetical protein